MRMILPFWLTMARSESSLTEDGHHGAGFWVVFMLMTPLPPRR